MLSKYDQLLRVCAVLCQTSVGHGSSVSHSIRCFLACLLLFVCTLWTCYSHPTSVYTTEQTSEKAPLPEFMLVRGISKKLAPSVCGVPSWRIQGLLPCHATWLRFVTSDDESRLRNTCDAMLATSASRVGLLDLLLASGIQNAMLVRVCGSVADRCRRTCYSSESSRMFLAGFVGLDGTLKLGSF